jgi:hypothetical protein
MDKPTTRIYAMDAMEKGDTFLKKATKYWNILVTSLSNHLNGRTRCRRVGPKAF